MLSLVRRHRRIRVLMWLLFVWVLVRNAWVCEDAYITLRVVDNLRRGLGPRWNALERVQVYTHPLWTMGLSALHAVFNNVHVSVNVLAIVCWDSPLSVPGNDEERPSSWFLQSIDGTPRVDVLETRSMPAAFFLEHLKGDNVERHGTSSRASWLLALSLTHALWMLFFAARAAAWTRFRARTRWARFLLFGLWERFVVGSPPW